MHKSDIEKHKRGKKAPPNEREGNSPAKLAARSGNLLLPFAQHLLFLSKEQKKKLENEVGFNLDTQGENKGESKQGEKHRNYVFLPSFIFSCRQSASGNNERTNPCIEIAS